MLDRFYAPGLTAEQATCQLESAEAHHLFTVLRGKSGLAVELFNGQGLRAAGTIIDINKRHATVAIDSFSTTPPPAPLTVAAAMPKGDRADWLVEKCVELGVTQLIPLITERGVVQPKEAKWSRMRRHVVEACKQCRRDYLMEISDTATWEQFLSAMSGRGWFLDVEGEALGSNLERPDWIAVGPEGGWTEKERGLARQRGATSVRLPGYVLRVETAAVASAALVTLGTPGF